MAPAVLPILMTLIFCTVCTGVPPPDSAPPPSADLISVCPAFNSSICIYAKPGPAECYNDSQCSDSKKCCCSGTCGLQCMVPDKVKAGQCPDIKAKCKPKLTYNCTSDSDCPGRKKCCSMCGTKCLDPKPETLMNCPKNEGDQSDSLECGSVKCTRDSDCKTREKCCASGNGRSCVKPIRVKPGYCPSRNAIDCSEDFYTCKSDGDCTKDQKCCPICGMNCWKPESAKPGYCPIATTVKCLEDTYVCKNDGDCPEDQKCCGICGKTCWSPE